MNKEQPGLLAQISQRGRVLFGLLFRLLQSAWKEYQRDYARYFGGAMVYYALVSMVPLVLLLLAVLGLLLRMSDLAITAEQQVLYIVETNFGVPLRVTIEELLQRLQQGSIVATVISLVGLMLAASVLFKHLRMTFRAIWKYAPPLASGPFRVVVRTTFLERAIAFVMVLTGGALLLVAFVLIAAIHWLSGLLSNLPLLNRTSGWLLALPIPFFVVPLTFALLFKFLPPVRLRWRQVWLATLLCSCAWLIGTEILALYGVFVGSSFSAYGAIGGVLIIMLWMNVVSQVLFYGAELCKVVSWSLIPPTQPGNTEGRPAAARPGEAEVAQTAGYQKLDQGPIAGHAKHG